MTAIFHFHYHQLTLGSVWSVCLWISKKPFSLFKLSLKLCIVLTHVNSICDLVGTARMYRLILMHKIFWTPWRQFLQFPQSLHANDRIFALNRPWPLPPQFSQVKWFDYTGNSLVYIHYLCKCRTKGHTRSTL